MMTTEAKLKIAPHSKESEMMVLGCMLIDQENLKYAIDELSESDFYFSEHKLIFKSMKSLFQQGKLIDVHLLSEELKRRDDLKKIGDVGYIVTLAQFVGTSTYVQEYVDLVKNKSILRNLIDQAHEIQTAALENPDNATFLIEKYRIALKEIEQRHGKKIPIVKVEEHLNKLENLRESFRGKKYLGLRVKTIEEFNENLLGLRKLNLLAAAPNVGKTALTIQLALEVLLTEPDACLAYFSLEMSSIEIFTRMKLYLAEMNFRTMIFGSTNNQQTLYSEDEFKKLRVSDETLKSFGDRLQIIDTATCPFIDSRSIINYVENLKSATKCKRALVVIDYLQVWPFDPKMRFPSENEADKWRIGEMKKIRDAMNEDPVIVISEARKPSGSSDVWGGDLSDVMGSARGTYTPDVVMLLSQLRPISLSKIWDKNNMPKDLLLDADIECAENEKAGMAIRIFLAKHGIALCKLDVPKARDGMHKFNTLLEFHFHKNIFKKVDWKRIKELVNKENPGKNNTLNFFN